MRAEAPVEIWGWHNTVLPLQPPWAAGAAEPHTWSAEQPGVARGFGSSRAWVPGITRGFGRYWTCVLGFSGAPGAQGLGTAPHEAL